MSTADSLLAELDPQLVSAETHDKWPSGANRGVARVSYTHDAMIDAIIHNPTISQNQLAAHFGYTPGWVSQIIASDAFQARLAERTGELVDPTIRASVEDRFKALDYIYSKHLETSKSPTWFIVQHTVVNNSLELARFRDIMLASGMAGTLVQFNKPYIKTLTTSFLHL